MTKELQRFSFEYDGKWIKYWNESRGVRWGHTTMEPPRDLDEENARWYYEVDGVTGSLSRARAPRRVR